MKGDLFTAEDRLTHVLKVPTGLRIATITGYLQDIDALLRHRAATGRHAARMLEQIAAFVTPAPATVKQA